MSRVLTLEELNSEIIDFAARMPQFAGATAAIFDQPVVAVINDEKKAFACTTKEKNFLKIAFMASRDHLTLEEIEALYSDCFAEAVSQWGSKPVGGVLSDLCPYSIEHGMENIPVVLQALRDAVGEEHVNQPEPPGPMAFPVRDLETDQVVGERMFSMVFAYCVPGGYFTI